MTRKVLKPVHLKFAFSDKRGDFGQKGGISDKKEGFRTKGFKIRNLCWFQVIYLKKFVKNPKGVSNFSAFYTIHHVIIQKWQGKPVFPTELIFQFYKTCWLPQESQFAEDPCSFLSYSVDHLTFLTTVRSQVVPFLRAVRVEERGC